MLLPGHREELAGALNRAILAHSGRREDSGLEAVSRQAHAALQVGAWGCLPACLPGSMEGWRGWAGEQLAACLCVHPHACMHACFCVSSIRERYCHPARCSFGCLRRS